MTIEAVGSLILEKILGLLPGWLARCFISSQKIAKQVEVDLRSIKPIDICFGTDIPRLSIYFRISNLSPVNLVFDRLLIDLWVGQPTLQGAILERFNMPTRHSRQDVYLSIQLTAPQQEQIRKHINGQFLTVPVIIHVKAYFDSKIGFVYLEKRFEHRDVPIEK